MFFSRFQISRILTALPLALFLNMNHIFKAYDFKMFDMLELYKMILFGGGIDRRKEDVLVCMRSMFPLILFLFLFGTWIYNDLKITSIYAFTRNRNRRDWYLRKCIQLMMNTLLYYLLYTGVLLGITCYVKRICPTYEVMIFYLSSVSILMLGTYLFDLGVNLAAVITGAKNAMIAGIIVVACGITSSIEFEKLPVIAEYPVLLKLNPLANMVCSWNVNSAVNSLLYFIVWNSAVIALGYLIISKIDVGLIVHED